VSHQEMAYVGSQMRMVPICWTI